MCVCPLPSATAPALYPLPIRHLPPLPTTDPACALSQVVCFLAGVGGAFTSIVSHFVFIFIDWVFWLSAAAALTQSLHGGINCSYNDTGIKYCSANNALIAFGWINFILTTFMLVVVGVIAAGAFRGGGVKETFNSRA